MSRHSYANISFCIPTLNRLNTICSCIDGILDQLSKEDEIIIVDGGSTDGTVCTVRERYRNSPAVKIYQGLPGAGLGGDLMQAITYASGDYCWLFSDDDMLAPGALDVARLKLNIYADISGASTNYRSFDPGLRYRLATAAALVGHAPSLDRLFTDPASCFRAFGMHLGYLSCQIVNRHRCLEIVSNNMSHRKVMNPWVVTYLVGYLQFEAPWLYISDCCVMNRTGNDSFLERMGEYKRQVITHVDFPLVVDDIFPTNRSVARSIRRTFLWTRMPRSIVRLKSRMPNVSLQLSLLRLYHSCYWRYAAYWLVVLPMFLLPNTVYSQCVNVYLRFVGNEMLYRLKKMGDF